MEETKPGYSVGKHLGLLRRGWVFTLICGFPSSSLGFFSVFGLISAAHPAFAHGRCGAWWKMSEASPWPRLPPQTEATVSLHTCGSCETHECATLGRSHFTAPSSSIPERDHTLPSSTPPVVCPVAEACGCGHAAGCCPQVQDARPQIWGSLGRRRGATCGCFHLLSGKCLLYLAYL